MDPVTLIDDLYSASIPIHYSAGERLFRPNETVTEMILVDSGIIRLCSPLKNGKEVTICFYNATQFGRFILGAKSRLTAEYYTEAVTSVTIRRIPATDFMEAIRHNPELGIYLSTNYVNMIKYLYTELKNIKYGSAYEKLVANIITLHSIAGEVRENYSVIQFKINHQMIADLTGLTRETVTGQLKKLTEEGLISYCKQELRILNLSALESILDGK